MAILPNAKCLSETDKLLNSTPPWVKETAISYMRKNDGSGKYEFKTLTCESGAKYFSRLKSSPSINKWKCNGSGPCVKDATGTYNSQSECEDATACGGGITPPPGPPSPPGPPPSPRLPL